MIKEFLNKLYTSPYGRLLRRFCVVGVAAVLPLIVAKTGLDPLTFIEKVMSISAVEWLFFGKVFIGAGILAGLDKLKREWVNLSN